MIVRPMTRHRIKGKNHDSAGIRRFSANFERIEADQIYGIKLLRLNDRFRRIPMRLGIVAFAWRLAKPAAETAMHANL
jgi:hypothetical protein